MVWLKPSKGKYSLIFLATSGVEYLVTLFPSGPDLDPPPEAAFETADGWIEVADGRKWPSLSHMAIEHGCIVGDFTSDVELVGN